MQERQLLTESLKELQTLEINKNQEKFVTDFISKKFATIGYVFCEDKISYWNSKLKPTSSIAGYVVFQPNGSQQAPDIQIIRDGKILVNIELKSSKQNHPMWNGGRVQPNTIYIFSKDSDTTYFLAEDTKLIPFYTIVDKFMKMINPLVESLNKESKLLGYMHEFYLRHMYNDKNNYFDKNRRIREQTVLNFIDTL